MNNVTSQSNWPIAARPPRDLVENLGVSARMLSVGTRLEGICAND
jgi:hypothetical protein